MVKNPPTNAGNTGLIPDLGRSHRAADPVHHSYCISFSQSPATVLSELQGGGGTRVRKNINFPLDLNVVFSWLGIFFFADTSKAFTKLFWSIYY